MDVQVLKALADENRMKIVEMLMSHNCCVRHLARHLGISEAAISQHLRILKQVGLVTGEKRGYFMHYSVNKNVLMDTAKQIIELSETPEKEIVCGCDNHNCCKMHKVKEKK